MEKDTLHGFRIRMALFAQVVNEMIASQLLHEEKKDHLSQQSDSKMGCKRGTAESDTKNPSYVG